MDSKSKVKEHEVVDVEDSKEATAMMNITAGKEREIVFSYSFNNGKVEAGEIPMKIDLARVATDTDTWNKTSLKYNKTIKVIGDEKEALSWYSMRTCWLAQSMNLKSDFQNYVTIHSLLAEAVSISRTLAVERSRAYAETRAGETERMTTTLITAQTKEEVKNLVSTKIFPLMEMGRDDITQALLSLKLWESIMEGIDEGRQEQKEFINSAIKIGADS